MNETFNRHQTWARGTPELYFFWECARPDEEEAAEALARALAHQPGSPEYHLARGLDQVESIKGKILSAARQRERLQGITPEKMWGVDLEGSEGPAGFTARYCWEVTDDLDAREFYVAYRYYGPDGSLIHREWKALFPNPQEYGENLDGGVGTVFTHWHDLPFPREMAGEVRILVRQKRKGKFVPPPLRSISGDRWLILGLPTDIFEKNT